MSHNVSLKLNQQRRAQAGFTLVELAIVLVIIGLIVGGVLVGQDLIKSAEIRATISQIEKFNAAANTFRDKHGNLPGDLNTARATQFNIAPTARPGTAGQGNGDGVVQGGATAATTDDLIGETRAFWTDLNQAQLIQDSPPATPDMVTAGTTASLPSARMNEAAFFHIFSEGGRNFFYIGSMTLAAAVVTPTTTAVTPQQAFTIDEKLDDGFGLTGTVTVPGATLAPATLGAAGANNCIAVSNAYNTVPANANSLLCNLVIRSSF